MILEILVGKIDLGEGKNFEMIVVRELEEEIGYCVKLLSYFILMYFLLGFVNEVFYIYYV